MRERDGEVLYSGDKVGVRDSPPPIIQVEESLARALAPYPRLRVGPVLKTGLLCRLDVFGSVPGQL